jgi:hypothetical protein
VPDNVTPLARPPIRRDTIVRSDVGHTFDVFVREIGAWWPMTPYSIGQEKVVTATVEQRLGGRVYETWADGSEATWGRVIAWEPPTIFGMTWELLPAVTEVELRFTPLGPAVTRVELEHRGWDLLTTDQLAAAGTVAGGYAAGWALVLESFRSTVEWSASESWSRRGAIAPVGDQDPTR